MRVLLLTLVLAGCLPQPDLPPCIAVTDCPPCDGWLSCRNGLCFRFGGTPWDGPLCAGPSDACLDRLTTAEDGCCAGATLDGEQDPDCLTRTESFPTAEAVSDPAIDGDVVFVTLRSASGLAIARIGDGQPAVLPLAGEVATPAIHDPVVMPGGAVVVASRHGVCRVSAAWALEWSCDRGGDQALTPLPLEGGLLGVATAEGLLSLLDEAGAVIGALAIGDPLAAAVATDDGQRAYVSTTGGGLVAIDVNGGVPVEAWRSDALGIATPLSLSGDGVVFADAKGRVRIVKDLGTNVSVSVSSDLQGQALGEIVIGPTGLLVATTGSSSPSVLTVTKGQVQPFAVVASTDSLTGVPLVTDEDRVFLQADNAVWRFDRTGDTLVPRWRWKGAGASPSAMNITASGQLVVARQPGTVLWLDAGAGSLAGGAWPRHRRTAGATAGLGTKGGR